MDSHTKDASVSNDVTTALLSSNQKKHHPPPVTVDTTTPTNDDGVDAPMLPASESTRSSPTKKSPARHQLPFEVIVKENGSVQHPVFPDIDDSEEEEFLEALQEPPYELIASEKEQCGGAGEMDVTEELKLDAISGDLTVHRHFHTEYHYKGAHRRKRNQSCQADLDYGVAEIDEMVAKEGLEDDDELEVEIDEDFTACFPSLDAAKEYGRYTVKRVLHASWKVAHFNHLPDWMQDNDFLHTGYRPPLPSFGACFKSVFAMHTETGNIWSHLLGCVAFIGVAFWFWTRPLHQVQWQEKVVFSAFFLAVIACLGLSSAFHTVSCHSRKVTKLFSKLDYVGISLLIVGSFVPWLFYGFYCRTAPKIVYITLICLLGAGCITVSLWDKFSEPSFRPIRAGMFVGIGLSGVVPFTHYMIVDGFVSLFEEAACHWIILMAALYIGGAGLYAVRVPERFFPGKCDIWFQSHQIFHLCVVVAAAVHYHGITELAINRLQGESCAEKFSINA